MVALGEFVLVEDGRCGVLVATPNYKLLAVWFGEATAAGEPIVELVEPTSVRRPEIDVPGYYH